MADPQTFQILRIAAYSDHPVRNSAQELIFGNHVLWEDENTRDGDKGSLAPNIFSYDFSSSVASRSSLNVTIKAIDQGLIGADHRLHGLLDGHKIFESDFFAIGSTKEVTVTTSVVEPHSNPNPFSWNAEFNWRLEQRDSDRKLDCAQPKKTRLELYWISSDIHEIFLVGLSGIPVDFLRNAFPSLTSTDVSGPKPSTGAVLANAQYQWATQQAFGKYSKTYDTVYGAPHFGVSGNGGVFRYSYYIAPKKAGDPPGSLQPVVNCYDQGAMVQVLGSTGSARPSWLFQGPYGYINKTLLVGNIQCNNPFYKSNGSTPIIGINDPKRTGFGNHVFNGELATFSKTSDHIYDACGGPHLGYEIPQAYVTSSIDTATNLYKATGTRPGGVSDIKQYYGVTGTSPKALTQEHSEGVRKLVEKITVTSPKSYSQVHWDDVPKWVKTVLGDNSDVAFQEIVTGKTTVEALWHLTGVSGTEDNQLVARVKVETRVSDDGKLDFAASSRSALNALTFELKNTQIDLGPNDEEIDTLWSPVSLEDYAQSSVGYASHLPTGRILIASGNYLIDLRGGSSTSVLEPLARSLLTHTTVEGPFSLSVPGVSRYSYHIPEANRGNGSNVVKGIGSSFNVKCELDHLISTAGSDVEGYGLLLSTYNIENNETERMSTATLTFVTRKLGTHNVDLRFAGANTLTLTTKRIQVEVVDA